MDEDRPVTVEEFQIVRPGQLRLGELRLGIAALREDHAVLQLHVGAVLPIRRFSLSPGESFTADGWDVELVSLSTEGRGSAQVRLTTT